MIIIVVIAAALQWQKVVSVCHNIILKFRRFIFYYQSQT